MSAEAIQNLEGFIKAISDSRSRLESAAGESKTAAGELAASRERFDGLAREVSSEAPKLQSLIEGQQATGGLGSLATTAGAGVPEDVDQLATQVGTDETNAVTQAALDLSGGHDEVRTQGLTPLGSAAESTESESRETQSEVTTAMEAAFKSVTLGMDAVQGQAEQVLPDLTGHMQRYAELTSNISVAGDGFANQVGEDVLEKLGIGGESLAASAASVGATVAAGGGSVANPGGLFSIGSSDQFSPQPAAGLINDGGAFFQQGAGIVAAGGGNVMAHQGGNIVAAGGGNIVAAGGGNVMAHQGPNIVAAGGGNIVAAGGGNVMAHQGGNIVAAGGGNIVAAGGGNIVAAGGGNIVAAGGGNIVAAGGGNLVSPSAGIVAAGGGNIVAAGGGNIVAAGGGNIVAAGGGNIVAAGGGNLTGGGGS